MGTQQNIPSWGQNMRPPTPRPVPLITIPRRFFYTVCTVAAGATSLLMISIGMAGSQPAQGGTEATPRTVSVSATSPTVGRAHRGPNAVEYDILHTAEQSSINTSCWAEWNEVQSGFEIICAPKASH